MYQGRAEHYVTSTLPRPHLDLISRHYSKQQEKQRPSYARTLLRLFSSRSPSPFQSLNLVPSPTCLAWVSFTPSFQVAHDAGTLATPTSSSLRPEVGFTRTPAPRFCSTRNTSRTTSLQIFHHTRWCMRGNATRRANISFRRSRCFFFFLFLFCFVNIILW